MGAHLSPTQTLAANERSNKACSTMAGALLRIAFLVFIFFGGAKGRSSLELPRAYVYNGQNKHDPYAAMLYDEMKTDLDMEDEEEGDYDIKDEDYDGLEYSGEIGVCLLQYLNRYTCPTQPEECESVTHEDPLVRETIIADCKRRLCFARRDVGQPYECPKNLPRRSSDCGLWVKWAFIPSNRWMSMDLYLDNTFECKSYVADPKKYLRELTDRKPFEPTREEHCDDYKLLRRMNIMFKERQAELYWFLRGIPERRRDDDRYICNRYVSYKVEEERNSRPDGFEDSLEDIYEATENTVEPSSTPSPSPSFNWRWPTDIELYYISRWTVVITLPTVGLMILAVKLWRRRQMKLYGPDEDIFSHINDGGRRTSGGIGSSDISADERLTRREEKIKYWTRRAEGLDREPRHVAPEEVESDRKWSIISNKLFGKS